MSSGRLRGDLEHHAATPYLVEGAVEIAALQGGAVKISKGIHDQSSLRERSVRLTGEGIQNGLVAAGV